MKRAPFIFITQRIHEKLKMKNTKRQNVVQLSTCHFSVSIQLGRWERYLFARLSILLASSLQRAFTYSLRQFYSNRLRENSRLISSHHQTVLMEPRLGAVLRLCFFFWGGGVKMGFSAFVWISIESHSNLEENEGFFFLP